MLNKTESYRTRYGVATAEESAQELLERAGNRLTFLSCVLNNSEGLTLTDDWAKGLATLLEDLKYNLNEARWYYYCEKPWNHFPGKVDEAPPIEWCLSIQRYPHADYQRKA